MIDKIKEFIRIFVLVVTVILLIPFVLVYLILKPAEKFLNFTKVKIRSSSAVITHFTDEMNYDRYHLARILICKEQKAINIMTDELNSIDCSGGEKIKVFYKKGRINKRIKIIRFETP